MRGAFKNKEGELMKNANGEGSIRKTERNGKTYWIGQITVGFDAQGKQIRKTFGNAKKSVVLQKMQTAKVEFEQLQLSGDKIRFNSAFDKYLSEKKKRVSANTYYSAQKDYRLYYSKSNLNNMYLKDIKTFHVQALIDDIYYTKNWKVATLKYFRQRLSTFFNWCINNDLISKNPCMAIKFPLESKKKVERVYTLEEQEKIIECLDFENVAHVAIYLDFFSGLRFGEIIALEWSDLHDNKLLVNKQIQTINTQLDDNTIKRERKLVELKSKSSYREVYIPPAVAEVLKSHRLNQMKYIQHVSDFYKNNNLIFANSDGSALTNSKMNNALKYLCKDAGVEYKSFHCIRHSYATRLFEQDAKLKTVQTLLGHSDPSITMNIYTHVDEKEKEIAADLLNILAK